MSLGKLCVVFGGIAVAAYGFIVRSGIAKTTYDIDEYQNKGGASSLNMEAPPKRLA